MLWPLEAPHCKLPVLTKHSDSQLTLSSQPGLVSYCFNLQESCDNFSAAILLFQAVAPPACSADYWLSTCPPGSQQCPTTLLSSHKNLGRNYSSKSSLPSRGTANASPLSWLLALHLSSSQVPAVSYSGLCTAPSRTPHLKLVSPPLARVTGLGY